MSIYRDSKRIVGTNADRIGTDAISGGWKEVGRTTLGSAGDTIDVTSLPDKRYYMVLHNSISTGNVTSSVRLNGDSGNNYAWRYNDNGGSDGTITTNNAMNAGDRNPPTGGDAWAVSYLANTSGKEKLMISSGLQRNSAGAGSAPTRGETASKWTGTDVIDQITSVNQESGDWASGSEMVVLGCDPDDTHTDNFWEQLAVVSLSSASDTLSSGTITAKKYLWVQYYTKNSGNVETKCRFNSDSGSNYAFRWSEDGGSDVTYTSQTECDRWIFASKPSFHNFFIVNNASNEKLITGHVMSPNTAGAGTAPSRAEFASKWTNTSDQITNITVNNTGSGDMDSGSFIKVWGSN